MTKYHKINKIDEVITLKIKSFPIYKDLINNIYESKQLIDKYSNIWDYYKKINNSYEHVYDGHKTFINKSILPISRSYFKFHEISIDKNIELENKTILCIAEAPGGFVKNILDRTKNANIYANSLISFDKKIPSWNKHILNNSNVTILDGDNKTGDIYNIVNIIHMINVMGCNNCDIITADGGIDYSKNYNYQELDSLKLLTCEIYFALLAQKHNGCFIIKFFDIFNYSTIRLIYILNLFYTSIEFVKPHTSRISNSEKYIYCSGFNINNIKKYYSIIDNLKRKIINNNSLDIFIPINFILDIYNYNKIFVKNQVDSIKSTIDLINSDNSNINSLIYDNYENANKWYIKYFI
uniref:Ribosomal RNA methyltransferase FtsJ domain-containing protein n=1 Tax=viral metagenome TaxID=1070528 RepID=A0A6C0CYP8_9ZZZZ